MIIDFHTHIFPSGIRSERDVFFGDEPVFESIYSRGDSRLAGKEDLLVNMDLEGVERSVVFGFPWRKADHYRMHNDYVIESVLENPDRLIGFCCFDPMSPGAPKEIERCLDAGMSGVGEIAVYDSDFTEDVIKGFEEVMSLCARRNAPVLLHVNEPVGHQYPGKQPMSLKGLYEFLKRYPANRIILAHWGGGIFFYELMKKEVRGVLANVWFDTAASPYLYSPDIYRISGEILGFGRILMGSDYPLIKPGRYMKEMETAGLSKEIIEKIAGLNARELLSLPNDSRHG
jgi:uncharacterized protein